eukprot:CAMPEP_0172073690 /NCGR_PEP_ID=MMETSP1043-20130122/14997_1 /TAXON_ID=464988 /ORGANISM="Hemiselmis andersenii, Strain CCMP441" /LENGTH=82 /DNA_ID=CAMNT_0012734269 /DNA_START=226 /DNA_END=471 /DNA_ORIENTATION=+
MAGYSETFDPKAPDCASLGVLGMSGAGWGRGLVALTVREDEGRSNCMGARGAESDLSPLFLSSSSNSSLTSRTARGDIQKAP